jgi:ABC-2 type transport system permease protein
MRWIGLKTLVVRECAVIVRHWLVTLAPPIITTILYFAVFGKIVGARIGSIDGVDYSRFMAPGLIVLWVVPYSFGHTASGLLGARHFKYIEELIVAPLPNWVILAGYAVGGTVRGLLVGITVALITVLFIHSDVHSTTASIATLLLTALVSAIGGLITAMLAKSFEQVTAIQLLFITPLTYLGGVFTSLSALPDWAQTLSLMNPIFHAVNAFRYGFLGQSDVPVGIALSIVCAVGAALFLVALRLLARGAGMREPPTGDQP